MGDLFGMTGPAFKPMFHNKAVYVSFLTSVFRPSDKRFNN